MSLKEEELLSGVVVRFSRGRASYPENAEKADESDFEFNNKERAVARERNEPAKLSVFDCVRATVAKVRLRYPQLSSRRGFGLEVATVRKVRIPGGNDTLKVVRDPLKDDASHCGIVGLERPSGVQRREFKFLRSKLADSSFAVDEECHRTSR